MHFIVHWDICLYDIEYNNECVVKIIVTYTSIG